MPKAWSGKDERQYEHIKEAEWESGRPIAKAKEIAARVVNKRRRIEGRTLTGQKRTTGTGNPNRGLAERTRDEVYNIAKERRIAGRSTMSKAELIDAVRARR